MPACFKGDTQPLDQRSFEVSFESHSNVFQASVASNVELLLPGPDTSKPLLGRKRGCPHPGFYVRGQRRSTISFSGYRSTEKAAPPRTSGDQNRFPAERRTSALAYIRAPLNHVRLSAAASAQQRGGVLPGPGHVLAVLQSLMDATSHGFPMVASGHLGKIGKNVT